MPTVQADKTNENLQLSQFIDGLQKHIQELEDIVQMHNHGGSDRTQRIRNTLLNSVGLINSLVLGDGKINPGRLTLQVADGYGDTFIKAGTIADGDFTNTGAGNGFILGIDDSDSNRVKFYFGNATNNIQYDGNGSLTITGSITATTGTIGGWSIGADYIRDAAGVVGMSSAVTGGDDIRFWAGDATPASAEFRVTEAGALTASNATITGTVTASAGTIGGFTLSSTALTATNLIIDSSGQRISLGSANDIIILDADDATYRIWVGNATAASAPFRVEKDGSVIASDFTATGGSISGLTIASIPNNSSTDISLLEKTWTMVFSVTDLNTIAWGSGTITLSNGRTFTISAGNTGNMAALTYVYLDPAVSSTVLQVTTTAATAMGANKILIGVAQNNTVTANWIPYGPGQMLVDGAQIGALSIVAGNIAASTITAGKMSVSQLSAIAADMGTITAGTVTGATIRTSASNPKFQMTSTAFQGIETGGLTVFEVVVDGANAGDVIMGDDASGNYAMWDDSAGTFEIFGSNLNNIAKFGGDGADGALTLTASTTTLDANAAQVFVKNYTSISITSTGKLATTDPHANGTIFVIKSQGAVTLTASAPVVDVDDMGATGGAASGGNGPGGIGTAGVGTIQSTNPGNPGTSSGVGAGGTLINYLNSIYGKIMRVVPGAGGGGGEGTSAASEGGAGGRGGGALIIECAGAWNFTTASGISANGANGSVSTGGAVNTSGGGGGGGSGGSVLAIYGTLTADSGTILATGGTGGTAGNTDAGVDDGGGGNGGGGGSTRKTGGSGGAGTAGGSGAGTGGAGGAGGTAGNDGSGGSAGTNDSGGGGGGGAGGTTLVVANTEFA